MDIRAIDRHFWFESGPIIKMASNLAILLKTKGLGIERRDSEDE